MRGLRSGQAWLYESETPRVDVSELHDALYEALIFGEGLGFLFDDDLVEGVRGLADAEAFWRRLTRSGPPTALSAERPRQAGRRTSGLTKFRGPGLGSAAWGPLQRDCGVRQSQLRQGPISTPNLGQSFTRPPQGGTFIQAEHPE